LARRAAYTSRMSESQEKRPKRMAGLLLQAMARLAETPGTRKVLYDVATRQLGLGAVHEARIADDVAPHRPLHLGGFAPPERDDG
jgi:hypothetical protein